MLRNFRAWFHNPKCVRNRKGKIIDDFKRRNAIKKAEKLFKSGSLKFNQDGGTKCYKVTVKSGLDLAGNM